MCHLDHNSHDHPSGTTHFRKEHEVTHEELRTRSVPGHKANQEGLPKLGCRVWIVLRVRTPELNMLGRVDNTASIEGNVVVHLGPRGYLTQRP